MEYLLLFLCCAVVIAMAYLIGRQHGLDEGDKTSQAVYSHCQKWVQSLKDEIEEIKNRPENWKNKIAEAKETFKNQ